MGGSNCKVKLVAEIVPIFKSNEGSQEEKILSFQITHLHKISKIIAMQKYVIGICMDSVVSAKRL